MLKNVIVNLQNIFRRYTVASVLNCVGLAVAFGAFLLLMAQIRYERSYDKSVEGWRNIFVAEIKHESEASWQTVVAWPYARQVAQSSPHVLSSCLQDASMKQEVLFYVEGEESRTLYMETFCGVTPDFADVFSFDFLQGSPDALEEPGGVLIPESMALRLFGRIDAVGEVLVAEEGENLRFVVSGVYRDFARNTSVDNHVYYRMSHSYYDSWNGWNFLFYVRLDDASHAAQIAQDFNAWFAKEGADFCSDGLGGVELRLVNLHQSHFEQNVWDMRPKADSGTLWLLLALAFVLLVIAAVNYTNFNMAMAPLRIKNLNTCKVFGASASRLRLMLIGESVLLSLMAYLLSLLLLYGASRTQIADWVSADLTWQAQYPLCWLTSGLAVLLGIVAGVYPAFYTTSFPPAIVLKGSFGLSAKGRHLRNFLVCVQFVAAFVLMAMALTMMGQNRYMLDQPLGYDKDMLIVSNTSRIIREKQDAVAEQLKSYPGVEGVAYAADVLGSGERFQGWGMQVLGKDVRFWCLPVTPDFLKTAGIEVMEGRDFMASDALGKEAMFGGVFICNEAFFRENAWDFTELQGDRFIGMVPDVKISSMREKVSPMAFYVQAGYSLMYNYLYVRVSSNVSLAEAMRCVKETLHSFDPDYPFEIRFYDQILQHTYEQERKMGALVTLCSLLAIFVSLAGVFGLVMFECAYRRKEIAIRKAMGATTGGMLWMLNRRYLGMLLLCFLVSIPVSVWFISRWLEDFAYRIAFPVYVFPLVLLLMALLVSSVVSYQSWQVASSKPLENLKAE